MRSACPRRRGHSRGHHLLQEGAEAGSYTSMLAAKDPPVSS